MKVKLILSAFGAVVLIMSASLECFSQDADLEQRVFNLGILRTGRSSTKSQKKRGDPKLILAQVQEDFNKLQVANNELAEANEKSENINIDFVIKNVTDIQTRAIRLMENLTESKAKKKATPPSADRQQLKTLVSKLDTVVGEFAHNPVFKEASPDDEKLAKKALEDLDQIIELSSRILKEAEKP